MVISIQGVQGVFGGSRTRVGVAVATLSSGGSLCEIIAWIGVFGILGQGISWVLTRRFCSCYVFAL